MRYALYFTNDFVWTDHQEQCDCYLPLAADANVVETITTPHTTLALVDNVSAPPINTAQQVDLRALFDLLPADDFQIVSRAFQLINWRRTAHFCAVCGTKLQRHPQESAMVCPACAALFYPRINPVVIVRVNKGDRILLQRRAQGMIEFFSVVAGFVEAGETLEAALHREVAEEVNIKIKNIRYFSSQEWSFPNNLMIGFTAEWADGELCPDGVEIGEAAWYRRDELPPIPGKISIARRMIDAWLACAE